MTERTFVRLRRITDDEYQADNSKRFWPEPAAVKYCRELLAECDAIADKEAFASDELYRLAVEGAERLAITQPWTAKRRAGAGQ